MYLYVYLYVSVMIIYVSLWSVINIILNGLVALVVVCVSFWKSSEYVHGFDPLWNTIIAVFTYEWPTTTIHNQHVGIQNMEYNIKTTRVLPLWEEYFWTFDMRQSVWTQVWLEISSQEKQDDISFVSLNQQLFLFKKIIIKHLRVVQNC